MIITPQLWLPKRYRQKPEKVGKWMDFPLKRDGRILPNLGNYLGDDRFRRLMAAWSPGASTLNAAVIHFSGSDTTPGSNQSETAGRLQLDYYAYDDEFATNLDYLAAGNGLQSDGWLLGLSSQLDICDANITTAGELTISPNINLGYIPANNFALSRPHLVREIVGNSDFDIDCELSIDAGTAGGLALVAIGENQAGYRYYTEVGLYLSGGVYYFYEENGDTDTLLGAGAYVTGFSNIGQASGYMRIEKVGTSLKAYAKKAAGDAWTQANTWTITNAAVLQRIGFVVSYEANAGAGQYGITFLNNIPIFSTAAVTATSIFTDPLVQKFSTYDSFITFLDNDAVTAGTCTAQCKDKTTGGAAGNIGASTSITTDGQSIDLSAVTPKDEFQFDMAQLSTTGASRSPCPTTGVLLYGPQAAAGGARGCWL